MAESEGGIDSIVVLGDSIMTAGFRLAGVRDTVVVEESEMEEILLETMDQENIGLIIISERSFENMNWKTKKRIEATAKPVVIPVPDRKGPIEAEESLRELVRRAMGLDLMKIEV
ncbi:MAG: V-type ATP synthase subunit F [Candidatus Altiarchaeota archaeon]